MSLVIRLFLLVAVALLPAIAIQTYNEIELRHWRRMDVQDQAARLARLGAAQQEQIVQGIRQVLIALSELPAIRGKDIQACNAYIAAIKQQYPAFLTFAAADTSGVFFCDTTVNHKPVNASRRPYFTDALQSGGFTVGKSVVGQVSGRRIIPFALPFHAYDARAGGIVLASLSLEWLADYIARMGIPEGAAVTISDRDGIILARYPDNDRFVGLRMPTSRSRGLSQFGTADLRDLDGVERIIGHSALSADSGGLLVSVGLDRAKAFAESRRQTQRGILLIFLETSAVLILTWLGARHYVHRPLGELVDAANQWRLGDYSRRVKISPSHSEVCHVGEAFNAMANTLEHRERDLSAAKEKAEEAAARIISFFESTTDGVLVVGRDWKVSYLNERAKAQLTEGRDIVGMNLWAAFPLAVRTDPYAQCRQAMSTQRSASFEAQSHRRDAWYEVKAFPSNQGLTVYVRDITEQKRALDARRLIEEQLHQSQKMEAVGQLVGGVAHDFNNLLAVILGNLAVIDDHAEDAAQVRQLGAAARQAADCGAKLTAQLLSFARRQTLNPTVVYADHLMREFEGLMRRAVGQGVELQLISPRQLWPCRVDATQLETALLNLALNGRDAMPEGGRLTIEARNVVADKGTIAGLAAGSYVAVSVADTGCGIPPDTLHRVFEPFFTTKPPGKGTGLGLSMVYGFVKQSGGHIGIESVVGAGTTITLHLPKAAPQARVEPETVERGDTSPGSVRILVVEDDEQVLQVSLRMLNSLGYEAVVARNGTDSIRLLKGDQRFDLLFSDIGLRSGMNGVELAREAKRLNRDIKIVLTSGNADDVLARFQAQDEFAMINKPFSKTDLARSLRLALHRH